MGEQLLFVVGLPGCGKTTYLKGLKQRGWQAFDDFKACARDDSPRLRDSQYYEQLISTLAKGYWCVVADIDFCRSQARSEAERVLREDRPSVKFAWYFFENNPERCEANIRRRDRGSLDQDLRKMHEYSKSYSIPAGARVHPVVGG